MPRPFLPALLTLTLSGESHKHEAPHFAFISSLLPFIPSQVQLSSTSLSHTFKPMSSLNWTTQISHPYKTCKITGLCILITMFLDSNREGKRSECHVTAHKPTCHNLQARRVELNNAASSEGCCFCWL